MIGKRIKLIRVNIGKVRNKKKKKEKEEKKNIDGKEKNNMINN